MKQLVVAGLLGVGALSIARGQVARKEKAVPQIQASSLEQNCALASELGAKAIRTNTLFLLLVGGIPPTVYPSDTTFKRQFHVQYFIGSCTPVMACDSAFNYRIFTYLQTTYGNVWQSMVRKDVIGLQEWQQRH